MRTRHLRLSLAFLFCVAALSCTDNSAGPGDPSVPFDIAQARNIPWRLIGAKFGDSLIDLTGYGTFEFLAADTFFVGDDGCNYFGGRYGASGEELEMITDYNSEMACFFPQFNPFLLNGRWKGGRSDREFTLARRDTVITFWSLYTEPVESYSFTTKRWRVRSSSDTAFALLRSHNLLPVLEFTGDRRFALRWYPSNDTLPVPQNALYGAFAISRGEKILFRPLGSKQLSPPNLPSHRYDERFMRRIASSISFSYSDTVLALFGGEGEFFYAFDAER